MMNPTGPLRTVVPFLVALLATACGGATTVPTDGPDPTDPHVLYPLQEENVWSYDVDTGTSISTLAITRVIARIGTRVEVSSGSDPVVYEIREEGIWRPASGTWLLRRPVRQGEEWPSSQGMVARVTSTTEAVETIGGSFTNCVRVEESGGDGERQIATVYCPEVGPVILETEQNLSLRDTPVRVSASLRGYQLAQ